MTAAERKSDFKISTDTPYIWGDTPYIWGVCCEDLGENLTRYNCAIGTAVTAAERKSDFKITTDTPYIWGVCCEGLGENFTRYNSTALY